MADATSAIGGVKQGSGTQPINENDFAYLKKVVDAKKSDNKTLKTNEQDKQKQQQEQQQDYFKPGSATEEIVSQITEAVNEYFNEINCDLELSYNKDDNMIKVKMLNKKTHELIKEFPAEDMFKGLTQADECANPSRGIFVDRAV